MYEKLSSDDSFDQYDEPRLHMERLMKAKLIEFDISIRILIPLEEAGIKTLGDLCAQSRKSLKRIRNLGSRSIQRLEKFLEYHMLSLQEENKK